MKKQEVEFLCAGNRFFRDAKTDEKIFIGVSYYLDELLDGSIVMVRGHDTVNYIFDGSVNKKAIFG